MSNSISIPRGLKSFMLKNCKVDFLGNSELGCVFLIHLVYWLNGDNRLISKGLVFVYIPCISIVLYGN
jgi:hypothetical protein